MVKELDEMLDSLERVDLPEAIADRFEPQLTKLQGRIARLNLSIDKATKTSVKKLERMEKKTIRKAKRREKLLKMIEKITKELEEDKDSEDQDT